MVLLVAQRLRRRKLRRMRKMPDSQWTKVRPHWICPTIPIAAQWFRFLRPRFLIPVGGMVIPPVIGVGMALH